MPDHPIDKLYLSDSYLSEYETQLVDTHHEHDKVWVRFTETIFYPEGGGQAPDRGSINNFPVHNVQLKHNYVWHQIDREISGKAHLKIDWDRRYANMQQHTGQHILSACFANDLGFETVSVHLGSTDTMIELEAEMISDEQLNSAQISANKIIRDAVPVEARMVPIRELDRYPVRRDIKYKHDLVRLLFIGDHDCTGCGGTHVQNTSEVGLIKITGTEKIRKHTRVLAKIGIQAYNYIDQLEHVSKTLAEQLHTSLTDLPFRISSMKDELKKVKQDAHKLNVKWLDLLADKIESRDNIGFYEFTDLNPADLLYISAIWVDRKNLPCYFVAPGQTADQYYFVFRTPSDSGIDGNEMISHIHGKFGLKGGGKRDFINGIMHPDNWNNKVKDDFKKELIKFIQKQ